MTVAGAAMAASDTASLAVGAVVINSCAIGSGAVDFGALELVVVPGAGTVVLNGNNNADSGASISIVCTNGASATLNAGAGLHAAGTTRQMISGTDLLAYELYTDSGRSTVLNPASIAYTGTGFATTTNKIYGRITAAQLAATKNGTYSDTVALTITYSP